MEQMNQWGGIEMERIDVIGFQTAGQVWITTTEGRTLGLTYREWKRLPDEANALRLEVIRRIDATDQGA